MTVTDRPLGFCFFEGDNGTIETVKDGHYRRYSLILNLTGTVSLSLVESRAATDDDMRDEWRA